MDDNKEKGSKLDNGAMPKYPWFDRNKNYDWFVADYSGKLISWDKVIEEIEKVPDNSQIAPMIVAGINLHIPFDKKTNEFNFFAIPKEKISEPKIEMNENTSGQFEMKLPDSSDTKSYSEQPVAQTNHQEEGGLLKSAESISTVDDQSFKDNHIVKSESEQLTIEDEERAKKNFEDKVYQLTRELQSLISHRDRFSDDTILMRNAWSKRSGMGGNSDDNSGLDPEKRAIESADKAARELESMIEQAGRQDLLEAHDGITRIAINRAKKST